MPFYNACCIDMLIIFGDVKLMTRESLCDTVHDVLQCYDFEGSMVTCERLGNGHINDTFLAVYDGGVCKKYTVQQINTVVFKNPDELMENIFRVTSFLAEKINKNRCDGLSETITIVKNKNGELYTRVKNGSCWRVFTFIDDAVSFDAVRNQDDFYNALYTFGTFQYLLADFPAATLHETICGFHDTPRRFHTFVNAVQADACRRVSSVKTEIDFFLAHEADMSVYADAYAHGELPLRVTHNDAKLNNVLLDAATEKGVCVIDLDTVMPGFAGFDFGDCIRFGASTGSEDETDLSKISFDEALFEAGARGFIDGCRASLTARECELLPFGAKLMTLESGMRFLTDYLEGDVYFKINKQSHNLDRCRTQIKLVQDFEQKEKSLCKIIKKII